MFDWLLFEAEIFLSLISVTGGVLLGLGIKNFAIPRIKQHIFDLANAYVAGFMQNLRDNPEMVQEFTAPFIDAIMKQLQGPGEGSGRQKTFKIFGFPVPQEIIQGIASNLLGNFVKKGGPQALRQASGFALPEG